MPVLDFKGPIEGYVVNFLSHNFWRVKNTIEWEDAMQEANVVYLKVINRYPDIEDAPHLMSLFQTAWIRRFTTLTNKDTSSRHVLSESNIGQDDSTQKYDSIGSLDNDGYVKILVDQAPNEIRQVLSLLLDAPTEFLEMAARAWRSQGRRCSDGNRAINKMLGFPEKYDALGEVERYLTK